MALPLWNSKTAHASLLCLHPNDGVSLGICGSGYSSNINLLTSHLMSGCGSLSSPNDTYREVLSQLPVPSSVFLPSWLSILRNLPRHVSSTWSLFFTAPRWLWPQPERLPSGGLPPRARPRLILDRAEMAFAGKWHDLLELAERPTLRSPPPRCGGACLASGWLRLPPPLWMHCVANGFLCRALRFNALAALRVPELLQSCSRRPLLTRSLAVSLQAVPQTLLAGATNLSKLSGHLRRSVLPLWNCSVLTLPWTVGRMPRTSSTHLSWSRSVKTPMTAKFALWQFPLYFASWWRALVCAAGKIAMGCQFGPSSIRCSALQWCHSAC